MCVVLECVRHATPMYLCSTHHTIYLLAAADAAACASFLSASPSGQLAAEPHVPSVGGAAFTERRPRRAIFQYSSAWPPCSSAAAWSCASEAVEMRSFVSLRRGGHRHSARPLHAVTGRRMPLQAATGRYRSLQAMPEAGAHAADHVTKLAYLRAYLRSLAHSSNKKSCVRAVRMAMCERGWGWA